MHVRRDREETGFCLGRAKPPAGLAHPGLAVRLSRAVGLWLGVVGLWLGVVGFWLGVAGRRLGASLGHAWFSLGRARPVVGPVSPGLARFVVNLGRHACTGRNGLRASIPGDSLTAAGAGAQVLGE